MQALIESGVRDGGVIARRRADVDEVEVLGFGLEEREVIGVDPGLGQRFLGLVAAGFADVSDGDDLDVLRSGRTLRALKISGDVTFAGNKAVTDDSASQWF